MAHFKNIWATFCSPGAVRKNTSYLRGKRANANATLVQKLKQRTQFYKEKRASKSIWKLLD